MIKKIMYFYAADILSGTWGPMGHVGLKMPSCHERRSRAFKIIPSSSLFTFKKYYYLFPFSSFSLSIQKNKQFSYFTLDFLFLATKRNNNNNGFLFLSRKSSLRFHFHSLCLPRVSSSLPFSLFIDFYL